MTVTESFGQPRPPHVIEPPAAEAPVSETKSPINAQCILPGPKSATRPFDIADIKGRTSEGKAAWWCRHDRLVVFDGLKPGDEDARPENEMTDVRHWKRLLVRTSKGLEISRKNCKKEVIHVDIPCEHCRDVLGKEVWMFEAKVKRLRVCLGCQEKCWREVERQEREAGETGKEDTRRDSFLMQEEKGVRKIQSERNLKA